ncbi:MAG: YraN family protein [Spirulinaceae cyanobacterium]
MMKNTSKLGELGEEIVAQWLTSQKWAVLHQRWRCRWGEIDIIAQTPKLDYLVFIEVKTRSVGNWDRDGVLAITTKKQAKLWQTAELFISQNPHLTQLRCRFDLALVRSKKLTNSAVESFSKQEVELGQPISLEGYQLTLIQYIHDAFGDLS